MSLYLTELARSVGSFTLSQHLHANSWPSGLLYRVGEFALVRFDSTVGQTVIRITDILSHDCKVCASIVLRERYKLNESDETETHPYSGSSLVVPSADHLTVLAVDLWRKVMSLRILVTTL